MTLDLLLIGALLTTPYQSTKAQTDETPYVTSIGDRTNEAGVAVSQDLLCPLARRGTDKQKLHRREGCPYASYVHYHDWLYIEGIGLRQVNDCMNVRHKRRIDVWVKNYTAEKAMPEKRRSIFLVEMPHEHRAVVGMQIVSRPRGR